MNAFLASIASLMNALVGLLIIGLGTFSGIVMATMHRSELPPFLQWTAPVIVGGLCFVGSVIIAALVCGLFAYLSEIERHLREMKEAQIAFKARMKTDKTNRIPSKFD